LENAIEMVRMDIVTVKLSDSAKKLYIEVFIETEISNSRVIIEDKHNNVVLIVVNGKPLKKRQFNQNIKVKHEDLKPDFKFKLHIGVYSKRRHKKPKFN
jgi:hypothetical protein